MEYPDTLRAGIIQFDIRGGDVSENQRRAAAALRRLSEAGADLAVLPELWSCGFDNACLTLHGARTPEILASLQTLAKSRRMLIAGSLPELADGRVYNTFYVVDRDGAVAGAYRKIHLFAPNRETEFFAPGKQAVVCPTSLGPLGLMICYDLRFPELCRGLALAGARVVLVCAQWPEARIHHWDVLLAARAIENQIFIIAANRVGASDALAFTGHSRIIAPDGAILAEIGDQSGEAATLLEMAKIESIRQGFDTLKERAPSAYRP